MKSSIKIKHIIEVFFKYAGIPYTHTNLSNKIQNDPYANTFFGIKNLLFEYKIDSIGLKLSLIELKELGTPVISQINTLNPEFIVLTNIDDKQCTYLSEQNREKTINIEEFEKEWLGVLIIPEINKESKEDKYYQNKILELVEFIKRPIIVLFYIFISIFFFTKNKEITYPNIFLFAFYNIGVFVCILLLRESLNINDQFARKICELNKKMSCFNVLNSKGAKLFDIIGWSEIGLIYFLGNLLTFLFIPSGVTILYWSNILVLPYTIWSIGYQRYVVKKWCILCLSTQLTLWLLFITFFNSNINLYPLEISLNAIINITICFIIPIFCLWMIIPILNKTNKLPNLQNNYNKIKSNETVFKTLLKEQDILTMNKLARSLVLGNEQASLSISVINNPYCEHCANMHKRLMKLLSRYPNEVKVELVFIGDDFMENTIESLISIYFNYERKEVERIYSDWFEKKEKTFKFININFKNENIHDIYLAQKAWQVNKDIISTPTIYVNNQELPQGYEIEDIFYLI